VGVSAGHAARVPERRFAHNPTLPSLISQLLAQLSHSVFLLQTARIVAILAQVVVAHLQALAQRDDPAARQRYKVRLVKGLYDRGWTAEDVRQLFRLIDWIMDLPPELQQEFRKEIAHWEEERRMPYVTSIERLAKEEGREEGRAEQFQADIATSLEIKFGAPGKRLASKIRKISDLPELRELFETILKADSLAKVRQLLPR
jgi:hypothetical protein